MTSSIAQVSDVIVIRDSSITDKYYDVLAACKYNVVEWLAVGSSQFHISSMCEANDKFKLGVSKTHSYKIIEIDSSIKNNAHIIL